MSIIVLDNAGTDVHMLIRALENHERAREIEFVQIEPGLRGKSGGLLVIDDFSKIEHLIRDWPAAVSVTQDVCCDGRRRRSKGDKHRNRKYRWTE